MKTNQLKLPSYGGQALIEGVLMRGKKALAAAYRTPQGEIVIEQEELKGIYTSKIRDLPILRGLLLLWDALGLGLKYLTASANIQTGEEEKIEGPELYGSLIVSFTFAIALFFVAPALLSGLAEKWFLMTPWLSNLVEGLIRLCLMIGYIWGIGRMHEIQRVFAYHGAEHKTINAFESGAELTPKEVKKFSLEHPKCGTSFLLTLVLISIIMFTLIGPLPMLWRILTRIVLIPLVAGLAYEYTRWVSNHLDSQFIRWMIKPNLALQRLTTREPDEEVIEVAIAAFQAMLELETVLSPSHKS